MAINDYSKLIFKPKLDRAAADYKEKLTKFNEEYFNIKTLEHEIKRIISANPEYRFIKVIIPNEANDKAATVPYARAYFDLYLRNHIDEIKELLERDEKFNKYVEIMSFKPNMANNSNMLYVKGLLKPGENSDNLNQDLKTTFEGLNPSWKVLSVHTKVNDKGAWGYVTFSTPEECKAAYDMLKPLKTTFRGNVIFANIKNQADNRAVIIYDLKEDVTQE